MRGVRLWWSVGARLALVMVPCACGELPRAPWVLSDAPRALALRLDVTEDGEIGQGFAPLPPQRQRAEVLPGDRVRLRTLLVTAEGPVDLEATQAAWFLCNAQCPFDWSDDVPDCADVEPGDVPACLAGRGAEPQLVVPGTLGTLGEPNLWTNVAVISGLDSPEETDACVAAMQARTDDDMQACAVGVRLIVYGPAWRMYEEQVGALDGGVPPEALPSIPVEIARMLPPNAAPEIGRLQVTIDDNGESRIHDLSQPLRLPAGAIVSFLPEPEPFDLQLEFSVVPGVANAYEARFEVLTLELFASAHIEQLDRLGFDSALRLRMSPEPTRMDLWIVVGDGRDARSWSHARLEVVAP